MLFRREQGVVGGAKTNAVVFISGHQIKPDALSLVIIQLSEFYTYLIALDPFDDCFYFNPVPIIVIEQKFYLDKFSCMYKKVFSSCFKSCTVNR